MTSLRFVCLLMFAASPIAAQVPAAAQSRIDSIFGRFTRAGSPGCALGVAQNGRVLLEKAYGLADAENGIAMTAATIMEAGSVSKQFTAALTLLLARDGRLSLDDDVRRWLPELPDYGQVVTLRHMIHHTSGLRDWGAIAAVGGWPRNSRALGHAHVLAIAARVRELNFPPGTEYDYSNTNYNLLAMVAERATGRAFTALTRERLFHPLGMTRTSWRDDAQRLVPGRAPSYSRSRETWREELAIESIYGNCCLLTTVGDLLRWNAAFDSTRLGAGFRDEQERQTPLTNGRSNNYAAGLVVNTYRGVRQVAHDGATAGYRAYLGRFPEQQLSVAVLCNAGDANAEQLGLEVAGQFLTLQPPRVFPPPARAEVPQAAIDDKVGLYRNARTSAAQRFVLREGRLFTESGLELIPQTPTEFAAATGGIRVLFTPRAGGGYDARVANPVGDTVLAERVEEADTSRAALDQYLGAWYSEEADARLTIARDSTGALVVHRAPDFRTPMRATYRDGFGTGAGNMRFTRDSSGQVTGMLLTLSRVRNLRFVKT